ncbi:MAG: CDP-alcohol phosphatidyltransferase family protein [Acidimicrobiales bacterium]
MSGSRTPTSAAGADPSADQLSTHRFLTAPNVFTLLRLCCIPIFCWLLFGKDDQVAAAWLLGGLGATDWVDGWLARRFHQVSEFGKIFDPTADRLLFIVAIGSIIGAGIPPAFVMWAIVLREAVVGITMAVATVAFGMERFDVTYWGKLATFLLMFAVPGFMLGDPDSGSWGQQGFLIASWILAVPGLALSYYTAVAYVPKIRAGVRAGRTKRSATPAEPSPGGPR